jgi:hypothetical protein
MAIDVSEVTVDTTPLRMREIARHLVEVDPTQFAGLDSDSNGFYQHVYDNTLAPAAPTAALSDNVVVGDADITFSENGPDSDTHVVYFLNPAVGTEDAATIVSTGSLISPAPTTSPHQFTAGAAGQVGITQAGVNEAGQGPWSTPSFATIT